MGLQFRGNQKNEAYEKKAMELDFLIWGRKGLGLKLAVITLKSVKTISHKYFSSMESVSHSSLCCIGSKYYHS